MLEITSFEALKNIDEEKLRAAYALNMCTVSVSQIVEYKDSYILEQEYEAILNNLNLEAIPKDEALLRTLTEILNTITFFRIQAMRKEQIEKEYQNRMKSAIWSAIPSISMITVGKPLAVAAYLATQVGTGYMNYRKEKASAAMDKEKAEFELEITAIEQLNALRRELFTTAWRLADHFGFPDCLRLTERQIAQYNAILADPMEDRKYVRMEAISEHFLAYPPFWYFFAHTALSLAVAAKKKKDAVMYEHYMNCASSHFETYYAINKFSILREDQLSASAYLEYADMLFLAETPDNKKAEEVIDLAYKMCGNANDALQMCAIAYLRAGCSDKAARLLRILINESYNTVTNAKLLSRLYVSRYALTDRDSEASRIYTEYMLLAERVHSDYLYPMPSYDDESDALLQEQFAVRQAQILAKAYRHSLEIFKDKQELRFNALIPAPIDLARKRKSKEEYYATDAASTEIRRGDIKLALDKHRTSYCNDILNSEFMQGILAVLNETFEGLERLSAFRTVRERNAAPQSLSLHDRLIYSVEQKLKLARKPLLDAMAAMENGTFDFACYTQTIEKFSFRHFTEKIFFTVIGCVTEELCALTDLEAMDMLERELIDFCQRFDLPAPESYFSVDKQLAISQKPEHFFAASLLGQTEVPQDNRAEGMLTCVRDLLSQVISDPDKYKLCIKGEANFDAYFNNASLSSPSTPIHHLRARAFALFVSEEKLPDLILCTDGIRTTAGNLITPPTEYDKVEYKVELKKGKKVHIFKTKYGSFSTGLQADILSTIAQKLHDYNPQ